MKALGVGLGEVRAARHRGRAGPSRARRRCCCTARPPSWPPSAGHRPLAAHADPHRPHGPGHRGGAGRRRLNPPPPVIRSSTTVLVRPPAVHRVRLRRSNLGGWACDARRAQTGHGRGRTVRPPNYPAWICLRERHQPGQHAQPDVPSVRLATVFAAEVVVRVGWHRYGRCLRLAAGAPMSTHPSGLSACRRTDPSMCSTTDVLVYERGTQLRCGVTKVSTTAPYARSASISTNGYLGPHRGQRPTGTQASGPPPARRTTSPSGTSPP